MEKKILRLLVLAVVGCFGSTKPTEPALLDSQWRLVTIDMDPSSLDVLETDRPPTLVFAVPSESGALPITGFGGCNTFSARAAVSLGVITVGRITSTEIACTPSVAEIESLYFYLLGSASRYEVSDIELLIDATDDLRLRFVRL